MAEEVTHIDSGTMENFIDQETVKKLKLRSKKLSEPVQLRNIDGTYNQSGSVTHFINLLQLQLHFSDLSVGALILSVWPSGRNLGRKVGKRCRF